MKSEKMSKELDLETRREIAACLKEKKKPADKAVDQRKIYPLLIQQMLHLMAENLTRMIFNKEQAAAFTTLSPETIDKAVDRGVLKCRKVGSRVIFFRDDLIEWVANCPPRPLAKTKKGVTA
jgi:glutamine synthetase adenylyltransferase